MQSDIALQNERYIIFASDFDLSSAQHFLRNNNIDYKYLRGKYKGIEEDSFIINKNNEHRIRPIIRNQESILELSEVRYNGERFATLNITKGEKQPLGYFTVTDKSEAEKHNGYIYDPGKNLYFIIREGK